nr:unnamed protein product [Callosobruchus chinensis]
MFSAISQPSVSRCIDGVTNALNEKAIINQWIKFPRNIRGLRKRFYGKYQFPGVVGIIDCTHVAITTPYGEYQENVYVNRKNYH